MDDLVEYCGGVAKNKGAKTGDLLPESIHSDQNDDDFVDSEKTGKGDDVDLGDIVKQWEFISPTASCPTSITFINKFNGVVDSGGDFSGGGGWKEGEGEWH
ncbi:hypothetical protein F0562_024312 [Nyssa sinensis]|uniref:Uncharacterized protein n=1 Tax=Nyssa sinensis TaxID=561372 RepID=A0A5J5BDJ9_9ASTE|nr:hypothetical protein F0562_024312 [Nyssa sinensis]